MVSPKGQASDWKEILSDLEKIVLIAESENTSIGYAWAQREKDKASLWDSELISLHLLPEYKRQGIGRRLFAAAAKQLKEQGCKSMYLGVLEENHPARKFYERLGGELAGTQPIELGDSRLTEVAYSWKDISQLENLR
jgi:ribosomal protein S18 acetylase RimI-like enzyme